MVDELIRRDSRVTIYDNLSTGFVQHLEGALANGRATLVQADILDTNRLAEEMRGVDQVFHLAANADVRRGQDRTGIDVQQNILGTHAVLEAMRITGVKRIVFTSSATVYGEPLVFPTPEHYGPMLQTSIYGASKLAAEAIIQAYCEYFGMQSHMFRFVSWIGERYSHGVIYDFVNKLLANPKELEILGTAGSESPTFMLKTVLEAYSLPSTGCPTPRT